MRTLLFTLLVYTVAACGTAFEPVVVNQLEVPDAHLVAADPARHRVYVTLRNPDSSSSLLAIDGESDSIDGRIDRIPSVNALAVNERTDRVYLLWRNGLTVVEGSTLAVVSVLLLPKTASFLALDRSTDQIHLGSTMIFDGATGEVTTVEGPGRHLKSAGVVDASRRRLYYMSSQESRCDIFDADTEEGWDSIELGEQRSFDQMAVDLDEDANRVYIGYGDYVRILDGETLELSEIALSGDKYAGASVAVDGRRHRVYAGFPDGRVAAIDAKTRQVVKILKFAGQRVWGIAVDEAANRVYASIERYGRPTLLAFIDGN